jgi:hypothetical protein
MGPALATPPWRARQLSSTVLQRKWDPNYVADDLQRDPPAEVRRVLRQEIGFGCHVPTCRSPFLEYHHFDPEWHVEHHHRPEGLIPLCPSHHAQAGAFTVEQLRAFKRAAYDNPVKGRFEWLRREIVGAVGGSLYHETPVLVQLGSEPMVWFRRDEFGHALLNVRMLTTPGNQMDRVRIQDNDFNVRGTPTDFETPPSGRLLRVRYANGDYMRIEFREIRSLEAAAKRFPDVRSDGLAMVAEHWPMTFVIITMQAGGIGVRFGPTMTKLQRNNTIRGSVMSHCGVGLSFG